jgi:hypothetical protein
VGGDGGGAAFDSSPRDSGNEGAAENDSGTGGGGSDGSSGSKEGVERDTAGDGSIDHDAGSGLDNGVGWDAIPATPDAGGSVQRLFDAGSAEAPLGARGGACACRNVSGVDRGSWPSWLLLGLGLAVIHLTRRRARKDS